MEFCYLEFELSGCIKINKKVTPLPGNHYTQVYTCTYIGCGIGPLWGLVGALFNDIHSRVHC